MAEDRMLNDEILLGLIKANGGGGGGTTNYNLLENKPQIAGTKLQGNKSLADLGIASADDLETKQDALTAGDYVSINNDVIKVTKSITDKTFRETVGYTGEIKKVTVPYAGKYKLQVWGASGGSISVSARGGYGGYSEGFVDLNANDELYVVVGGKGNKNSGATAGAAGYNGGGNANQAGRSDISRGSGGGATHIAKVSGVLSALSANVSDILIVAGGGGGAGYYSGSEYGIGGSGGGYRGANGSTGAGSSPNGNGGTENAGGSGYPAGSFGQGGNRTSGENYGGSGGGGGFYGGGASQNNGGAGGGSGYLNQNLEDGCMYGFGVPETSIEGFKTISVNTYDSLPVEKTAKEGDGYAIISLYTDESADLVTKGDMTDALESKQNTLTFDDTPTDGSNNPVKSNGIYDSEKDIYATMGEMGAKNLIPYPYYNTTKTVNGITFTDNGDGTISVTGSAEGGDANFVLHTRNQGEIYDFTVPNGNYILSGCPSGGSSSSFLLNMGCTKNDAWYTLGEDFGNGKNITCNGDDHSQTSVNPAFNITIKSGYSITGTLTFKPMLRLASDTDNTYQPYAKTNKQLTDDVALLNSGKADTDMVAADFNAGTSYTAGDYCVQDGKLYKFKNNHSGAWSSADVDEVKITGELSSLKSGLIKHPITFTANTGYTIEDHGSCVIGNVAYLNFFIKSATQITSSRVNVGTMSIELPLGTVVVVTCPSSQDVDNFINGFANVVFGIVDRSTITVGDYVTQQSGCAEICVNCTIIIS